ncbi:MAG: JDVT-CTERM system CAAX-type protease [Gammaproteobacteria bacterium]|nr:JDVT-CTERM system CAAX-type protease [Gammaproteobacteria bacterium]
MNQSSAEAHLPWQDPLFYAALMAGPCFWLALYLIQQPVIQWSWPLVEPWQFLVPVVFYPLAEEMVFRGLLQELVHDYISRHSLGPITVANLLTSVMFTGLHFIYHAPVWAALVFIPSLIFGFFKDRTGRLAAPILLHVFYNAGFLWLFTTPAR